MDFTNTKISLRRPITSYSKLHGLIGWICRAWPVRKAAKDGDYLNIGCGPFARPDYYNIDYDFHPGVDLYWDLRKPLPINDGTAGGAFSEHCLEHLTHQDGVAFLRDVHRVLKPGGILRISVPDGGIYFKNYVDKQPMPYEVRKPGYAPIQTINRLFYESGHRYIYDYATMELALKAAGFNQIRQVGFRQGGDPKLLMDQEDRAIESLYVEAVKD